MLTSDFVAAGKNTHKMITFENKVKGEKECGGMIIYVCMYLFLKKQVSPCQNGLDILALPSYLKTQRLVWKTLLVSNSSTGHWLTFWWVKSVWNIAESQDRLIKEYIVVGVNSKGPSKCTFNIMIIKCACTDQSSKNFSCDNFVLQRENYYLILPSCQILFNSPHGH